MREEMLYELETPYRQKFRIKGFRFGEGEKACAMVAAVRGNEVQQMYVCALLVKKLRKLEEQGAIAPGNELLVVPCVNHFSMNVGSRFWAMDKTDINRMFPGYDQGETTQRIAAALFEAVQGYKYGIHFASFYLPGDFVPHVRIMNTGYQTASLGNLFGLPYVVMRKPEPIDTTTLNYNWQVWETNAFSVYTKETDEIDERSADETPFVVEWFVRNGIRVWSTQEGEQRFDNHTDKLLNYIRFWQADGESEKTSVRTRTSLRQLVEEGHFKGGSAPYGYDLVKSGRINKRKHELYELHINEREAAVVRIIFDKYVHEGYGPQHIVTYLNDNGYRARSGKCWHPASIRGMVRNLTYTGVLRCGDAHSELLQELQIIPEQQFEVVQRIRENRSNRAAQESEYRVPLNIHGQSLLSGNAYCGHCGAKLTLTSSRKWRKLSDGTLDDTLRVRYTCYGKLRKQTGCTGQTGYTVHILDEIIDKSVRQIFSKMRGIPKEQIITRRYEREVVERKNHLQTIQVERDKDQKDLISLKAEILACIKGESVLPKETLAEMITAQEEKLRELDALYESSYAEAEKLPN